MQTHKHPPHNKVIIGWREWCALPKLGLPAVKVKIDTGADTSALHAFDIETFHRKDKKYVRFSIHPLQGHLDLVRRCTALIVDERKIMSSNGHSERRYVIATPIKIGNLLFDIEITLSNRDPLKFRMLLGRQALKKFALVDPAHSYSQGTIKKKEALELYSL